MSSRRIYDWLLSFFSTRATTLFKVAKLSVVTSSSSISILKRCWTNETTSITPCESITLPSSGVSSLRVSVRPNRNSSSR